MRKATAISIDEFLEFFENFDGGGWSRRRRRGEEIFERRVPRCNANVFIRVFTSIPCGQTMTRDVGTDRIKITACVPYSPSFKRKSDGEDSHGYLAGSLKVNRMENWRDNLASKILEHQLECRKRDARDEQRRKRKAVIDPLLNNFRKKRSTTKC